MCASSLCMGKYLYVVSIRAVNGKSWLFEIFLELIYIRYSKKVCPSLQQFTYDQEEVFSKCQINVEYRKLNK